MLSCESIPHNLREFVKTHVILAPLREFSRSRAASKIPFPGAKRASSASRKFFILGVKIGTCAPAWFEKSKQHMFCLSFCGRLFHLSCKNRYLRFRRTRNDRKTQCFSIFFVNIDENRCTVVQNQWNSMYFISKTVIPLRRSLKKSKKRQAKTQLLQIRSTPIALAASLPDLLIQL